MDFFTITLYACAFDILPRDNKIKKKIKCKILNFYLFSCTTISFCTRQYSLVHYTRSKATLFPSSSHLLL